MKQEDKELLLKDLCARLPYGLKVCHINLSDEMPKVWDLIGMTAPHLADILVEGLYRFAAVNIKENIRPYLRPMSSMTEEERNELSHYENSVQITDFFYSHHIDCRFMIEKGLAIKAKEGMYNINEK